MKKLLPILLVLSSTVSLFSQQPAPRILCGNEIFTEIIRSKCPELQQSFDATFENARQHQGAAADRSPLNVKVVVHVVYKNPEENLDDSIILNQIQVLNQDFNRLNADTANLRAQFVPAAGNANIHFELAEVVRVQTAALFSLDILSGSLLSNLKHDNTGGSEARDPEKYLNIWVCKIQPTVIFGITIGQILGFAFPPNGLANWPDQSGAPTPGEDGVAIDFRAFGSNNPNPMPNPSGGGNLEFRGRTPVHEVGHYFGLRHIWGDGGLLGANDCAQSDGVDDTPFANAQSDFDCNTARNTCHQVEPFYNDDVPDLIENYMDYSSETCMNMFTKGQVEIMRNVLTGPRSGLLSASGVVNLDKNALFSVFPNPTTSQTTVSFMVENGSRVSARVVNTSGQTVLETPEQFWQSGLQSMTLDTKTLPAGLYFVELAVGAQRHVQKLVRQ